MGRPGTKQGELGSVLVPCCYFPLVWALAYGSRRGVLVSLSLHAVKHVD